MTIKIKKLVGEAVIPKAATDNDAGLDLTAISKIVIDNGRWGYIEYGTGLSIEIPQGYAGFLFPRSSISDTGLVLANSVGLIDSGYRGEVKLRFKYIADSRDYDIGDRVGQLIIMPIPKVEFEEVEELTTTTRGEGGFGSTN